MQILRQDLDNHLHDSIQQHLLLLLNDSVENKKKNDELSTKNQLLTNQLKNDSVEHKKRIDELFTENQKLNKQLKKTNELSTKNQLLNNQLKNELFNQNQLLRKDSVEHKKRIDELFTENQRLNQGQYHSVLQPGNEILRMGGYNYYPITLASLPVTRIINNTNGDDIDLKITVCPKNIVSLSFKANANGRYSSVNPILTDFAVGQPLKLKCVVLHREYICKQSINELKHMGYIVNDEFLLRIH